MLTNVARAITHSGRLKKVNEDGILQIPDVPLYVVVDGRAGTEAKTLALDIMRKHSRALYRKVQNVAKQASTSNRLDIGSFFKDVFKEVHEALLTLSDEKVIANLATSMIACTLVDECAYVAHIGNGRAYLLRNDELWAITNDHTVAMAQLVKGMITPEEYELSPNKLVLTQALGLQAHMEIEFAEVWLLPGDLLFMCSDGLTRVVSDQEICQTLHGNDITWATKELLRYALDAGAPDNVSLVTIKIDQHDKSKPATSTNIQETVRSVFLFKDLTEPDRMVIAPYLEDVSFPPNYEIVKEGDIGDLFYIILEGRVRVSLGQTHLVDIGPGGQFGELGLVGESRRTATVTTLTHTRLFALSRERFHELLQAKPKLAGGILLPLLERVKDRLTDVTERLAKLEEERS